MLAGERGERLWWCLHPLRVTQQYCLASMAARFTPTGISHHSLLPHIPSSHLFAVNISPHPEIAPQSELQLPATAPSGVCMAAARTVWFSFHLILILIPAASDQLFHSSCKCFSSDSDNCPDVAIKPLLQFPHRPRPGPILLTLLFFPLVPSSYRVLHGSTYSFPLVRYSSLPSAGVQHALLCLKVYSWCIHGERSTPRPPTPLPSCSLLISSLIILTLSNEWQPLAESREGCI